MSPRDFPRAQAIFHCISQQESQYRYSQLQLQYCYSWESNIEIVDYPYCSVSSGYIFQYTPSRAGPIRENIAQLIEQYWSVKFQYYRMYTIFKHELCHALGVIHTQKPTDRDDGQIFWVINITKKLTVLPEQAIKPLGPRLIEVGPHSKLYLLVNI